MIITKEKKDTVEKEFVSFPDVAADVIKVLSGEIDTDDIEKWMEDQGIREEDELTVCELFDQYIRQGRVEGENRFARLMQVLMDSGKSEELKRAVFDQKYREKLYVEVGLQ